jgi:hypothetical protein
MRILSALISIPLLVAALVGCKAAKTEGETRYLVLWPDATGTYRLQEITLTTLPSAYELKGEAAEIYFESALREDGFKGPVAKPHLTKAGDVYIPQDIESSLAITAYAHFEKLYLYDRAMGFADRLSWPRKVGVQIHMSEDAASTHNNAHYFSGSDSIALLPFSLDAGVPMGINLGVTAHEHFHAHFQKRLMDPLNKLLADKGLNQNADKFGGLDFTESVSRNNVVLRGWNEGLADFYASVYSGFPDFFRVSIPSVDNERNLDGKLAPFMTDLELTEFVERAGVTERSILSKTYGQGTILGRLLRRISKSRSEEPRLFLQRVMAKLDKLPEYLSSRYLTGTYSYDAIVPVLLEGEELNADICKDLRHTLTGETLVGNFGACDTL